jgi:uncharacterized protein
VNEVDARQTALITGGGGGIGRELCRLFHAAGCNLVVVSLLADELELLESELAVGAPGQKVIVLQKDLSEPGAADEVFEFCEGRGIRVDVLVNNAGFGLAGETVRQDPERVRRLLVLNMMTTTILCRQFGAAMMERKAGHILNVASTISFQPLPWWGVYAASKAYVSSFTQTLSCEMRPYGVTVSALYPGITRTSFLDTAGLEKSESPWSVGSLIHAAAMDSERVARAGFRGLYGGKRRIIPGLSNKLHFLFIHWIPTPLILAVVRAVMRRYHPPRGDNPHLKMD